MKLKISLLLLVLSAVGLGAWQLRKPSVPPLSTPYQAVLLTNGSVFYGHLEGLGTAYPILKEVYYIQTGVDSATKQPTSVLLRRGQEWHGPDQMLINAAQILLVEPVTPNSRVAQLIADARK